MREEEIVETNDSPDHGRAVRVKARTAKRDILLSLIMNTEGSVNEGSYCLERYAQYLPKRAVMGLKEFRNRKNFDGKPNASDYRAAC